MARPSAQLNRIEPLSFLSLPLWQENGAPFYKATPLGWWLVVVTVLRYLGNEIGIVFKLCEKLL